MVVLQNGGQAGVVDGYLVVSRPVKFDEEGRHVPVKEDHVVVRLRLDEVEDVMFVRATRLGEPGAVTVKVAGNTLILRVLEEDGKKLVRDLQQPVRYVMDVDHASASDDD